LRQWQGLYPAHHQKKINDRNIPPPFGGRGFPASINVDQIADATSRPWDGSRRREIRTATGGFAFKSLISKGPNLTRFAFHQAPISPSRNP
jgi:hypothetical protein